VHHDIACLRMPQLHWGLTVLTSQHQYISAATFINDCVEPQITIYASAVIVVQGTFRMNKWFPSTRGWFTWCCQFTIVQLQEKYILLKHLVPWLDKHAVLHLGSRPWLRIKKEGWKHLILTYIAHPLLYWFTSDAGIGVALCVDVVDGDIMFDDTDMLELEGLAFGVVHAPLVVATGVAPAEGTRDEVARSVRLQGCWL